MLRLRGLAAALALGAALLACVHAPVRENLGRTRFGGEAAVEAGRHASLSAAAPVPRNSTISAEGRGAAIGGGLFAIPAAENSAPRGRAGGLFRGWTPRPEEAARVEAERRALAEELVRRAAAQRAQTAWRGSPAESWDAARVDRLLTDAARRRGLDPDLVRAVARVESGLDHRAVSPKGAMGLMQLMPDTAAELGVSDPFDPRQSAEGGAEYLRRMLDRFGGDLDLALAAYNAGPGAVERHGGAPPYAETKLYVEKVKAEYAALKEGRRNGARG